VPEHSFGVWTIQARPIYPVTGYWCLTSLNTAEMISNWCTFTQWWNSNNIYPARKI